MLFRSLRVRGVRGLRVADASVMPSHTSGNTNLPSMMVGEKAADHILGRDMLARDEAEPWVHPEWRERQR